MMPSWRTTGLGVKVVLSFVNEGHESIALRTVQSCCVLFMGMDLSSILLIHPALSCSSSEGRCG